MQGSSTAVASELQIKKQDNLTLPPINNARNDRMASQHFQDISSTTEVSAAGFGSITSSAADRNTLAKRQMDLHNKMAMNSKKAALEWYENQ